MVAAGSWAMLAADWRLEESGNWVSLLYIGMMYDTKLHYRYIHQQCNRHLSDTLTAICNVQDLIQCPSASSSLFDTLVYGLSLNVTGIFGIESNENPPLFARTKEPVQGSGVRPWSGLYLRVETNHSGQRGAAAAN